MTKRRTAARDVGIGIVLTAAAVILGVAIFSIGSEQHLWTRKVTYRLSLPNTNGLQVGAPVRLSGVNVGTVSDIRLPSDPSRVDIEVTLSVDDAVRSRIRADTHADLKVLSLLAGDRFVDLSTGSPSEPELPPGSFIKIPEGVTLDQLQALGASIADDLQDVTGSLKVILDQMQNKNTLLGQALFDPNFGREAFGAIGQSLKRTDRILAKIEHGHGLLGRMLTDQKFADSFLSNLDESLARMENLMEKVAGENAPLGKALEPGGQVSKILGNLETSSENLRDVSEKVKNGEGVAGKLVSDRQYADELLGSLKETTEQLKEILTKLNRGEGTAGAFLNDPAVYQELQDVLRGVRKSRTLSWLIRHYRKKGEKAREKEEEKTSGSAKDKQEGM